MKTTTIPSLRVKPELRQATENVLREGETLSNFMKVSLQAGIRHREVQQNFITRGLASKDEDFKAGEYYSEEVVHEELLSMLTRAEKKGQK